MADLLKIENISLRRNHKTVLNDISIKIPESSIINIYGSNGSGKTSFLKILAGITEHDAGMIRKDGLEIVYLGHKYGLKNNLTVYEHPIKNHTYALVADTAQGKGVDYSAFSVFDVSEMPYRQVAVYRDNQISPMLYPNVIYNVGNKYNMAHVLVEVNDIGSQVADTLHYDLEYENIMIITMRGRAGQQISGGFSGSSSMGIRTTKQVKRIGCSNLIRCFIISPLDPNLFS